MIYLGIDDTDNTEGGGTGRVARELAAELASVGRVYGVSRHQLLVDARVPYTRNNSCNVIHLTATTLPLEDLAERVAVMLAARCLPGSDPGLCLAERDRVRELGFGRKAQTELVTQAEALALARACGVWLRPLGGTGDGIIGALAGVALAATGEDGRYVELGGLRALAGRTVVARVLEAGVAAVYDPEGAPVADGWIENAEDARPDIRRGRAVLRVEPVAPGVWRIPERRGQRRLTREENSE